MVSLSSTSPVFSSGANPSGDWCDLHGWRRLLLRIFRSLCNKTRKLGPLACSPTASFSSSGAPPRSHTACAGVGKGLSCHTHAQAGSLLHEERCQKLGFLALWLGPNFPPPHLKKLPPTPPSAPSTLHRCTFLRTASSILSISICLPNSGAVRANKGFFNQKNTNFRKISRQDLITIF